MQERALLYVVSEVVRGLLREEDVSDGQHRCTALKGETAKFQRGEDEGRNDTRRHSCSNQGRE